MGGVALRVARSFGPPPLALALALARPSLVLSARHSFVAVFSA